MGKISNLMEEAIQTLAGGVDRREEGVHRLNQASTAGDGQATAFLAALSAMGVVAPPDIDRALTLLVVAAEQGSVRAQGQLRVLAGLAADANASDWSSLAAEADLAVWLSPPRKQSLCEAPRIRLLPGFLSRPASAWLIGVGRGRAAPASVYDAETGGWRMAETRSNSAFELGLPDLDVVSVLTRAKIASAVGVSLGALESPQLLHYAKGQRFERHYDYLDVSQPGYALEAARQGQRIATCLIYLNADYEGGATEFCRLGLAVKGEVGDGLMFANVDTHGAPDPATLHRGAPPTLGEKWLLSQWVRDRVQTV